MKAFINWVDEALSTNSLMAELYDDSPNGTVVAARRQTAGRGQRGNKWESEPYRNLTFSIMLRPASMDAAEQFALSMIVALAVCDELESVTELPFCVKWPNDIYCGDMKVCGILIENSIEGRKIGRSIAGIGINVNQRTFYSDAPNPQSLVNLTGKETNLDLLLRGVCTRIVDGLEAYEARGTVCRLSDRYFAKLWRGNGVYKWTDVLRHEVIEASVETVASSGLISLRLTDGTLRSYAFKEVSPVM